MDRDEYIHVWNYTLESKKNLYIKKMIQKFKRFIKLLNKNH